MVVICLDIHTRMSIRQTGDAIAYQSTWSSRVQLDYLDTEVRYSQCRSQDLIVVGHLIGGTWEGCPLPTGKEFGENFRIFGVRVTCFEAFLALF